LTKDVLDRVCKGKFVTISKKELLQNALDFFGLESRPAKVALVRGSRKGEKMEINGREIGGESNSNSARYYSIYRVAKGFWECSCPAHRENRVKACVKGVYRVKPCKHLKKYFNRKESDIDEKRVILI
jgi:hypothetical protein